MDKNAPPTLAPDALAEAKANFLAVISHELRTPMQSIYGLLEMMADDHTPPEEMHDLVTAAQGSAMLMLGLLDDILDYARLDAEKTTLDQLEVPVRTLAQGVVEAMRGRIGGRTIDLKAQIDDDVPIIILGDPKRLRQILFNLVGNALKFTRAGHVTIHIIYAPSSFPDQHRLRFEIIDTGIGLAPGTQDRLFVPFSQGDDTITREYGGAGLGLSICKKLVNLMGGEIGAETGPTGGAVFWFEIPCIAGLYQQSEGLPDLSGLHILVADSHPNAAREIEQSLKQMNAHVHVVTTLTDAARSLSHQRYDVLIADHTLTDGGTLGLLRQIAQDDPRLSLIMYTFAGDGTLPLTLQALGITYLAKPASRQGLGQTVLDVARKHWGQRDDVIQRVLLAEDTQSVRDILVRHLRRLGVATDIADCGQKAFELALKNDYGLIITDLHMPDIDGQKLAGMIQTHKGNTAPPIILLTADLQWSDRRRYQDLGFHDCLIKPVTFRHLRQALERWGIKTVSPDVRTPPDATTATPETDGSLLDIATLMQQMDGTREEAIAVLKSFPTLSAPLMQCLRQAANNYNIAEAAHSLKGAARFACCNTLADLCDNLQQRAEQNLSVQDEIAQTERLFVSICSQIQKL